MVNKRGYSFGAEYPIHYEDRGKAGWAVFDARNDKDIETGLEQWEAQDRAWKENGSPKPDLDALDTTP